MATAPKDFKLPAGRPTKLNEELIKQFESYLLMGNYVETVCEALGVSRDTYYNWIKEGDLNPDSLQGIFSDTIQKARAQAEINLVKNVGDGKERWQGAGFILERSRRERWARINEKDQIIQPKIELNLGGMSPDEAIDFIEKLTNDHGDSNNEPGGGESPQGDK